MGQYDIRLVPMTADMLHRYFREYENDADLCLEGQPYLPFAYSKEWVDRYIQRLAAMHRISLAILCGDDIAGEVVLRDIEEHRCATMGICLKNARYKDRGIGTQAERLAIQYVFRELDIPTLFADAVRTNARSRHVLEKAGFVPFREDMNYTYYRLDRDGKAR